MANQDRIERFSKIRALLGFPLPQSPSPHEILNQMLTDEQWLLLRLTNTEQGWNLIPTTVNTVSGTSAYTITQPIAAGQNPGKVHFVLRSTGHNALPYVPIDFDDYSSLDYGEMPLEGVVNAHLLVPERVAFYRSNGQEQAIKMVIQPTPQEVLTYAVEFHVGSVDRSAAVMTHRSVLTELTDFLDLKSSLHLTRRSKWGTDDVFNQNERKSVKLEILEQLASWEPVVNRYIKRVNGARTFEMDAWNS